jgi:hypothetical protein
LTSTFEAGLPISRMIGIDWPAIETDISDEASRLQFTLGLVVMMRAKRLQLTIPEHLFVAMVLLYMVSNIGSVPDALLHAHDAERLLGELQLGHAAPPT